LSSDELRLERLSAEHDLAGFSCGVEALDDWLRRHALAAQKMDSARSFVVARGRRVVAYVSMTMGSVQRTDPPAALVRGMPAYPVGMVLISRLAVDQTEQGAGLGARLLADALRMAVLAGENAAARLVAVDAIDEPTATFYRRHGFTQTLDHPLRLYRRIKDVRASIQRAEPGSP
jgi:GNAT superfamily N-acetyltransferase